MLLTHPCSCSLVGGRACYSNCSPKFVSVVIPNAIPTRKVSVGCYMALLQAVDMMLEAAARGTHDDVVEPIKASHQDCPDQARTSLACKKEGGIARLGMPRAGRDRPERKTKPKD